MGYDTTKAFAIAHRPGTIVITHKGSVGYISEASINDGQDQLEYQLSYAVTFLYIAPNDCPKHAWWSHSEMTTGGNLWDTLASGSAHPFGGSKNTMVQLMERGDAK